jgi:hypothetical protein
VADGHVCAGADSGPRTRLRVCHLQAPARACLDPSQRLLGAWPWFYASRLCMLAAMVLRGLRDPAHACRRLVGSCRAASPTTSPRAHKLHIMHILRILRMRAHFLRSSYRCGEVPHLAAAYAARDAERRYGYAGMRAQHTTTRGAAPPRHSIPQAENPPFL